MKTLICIVFLLLASCNIFKKSRISSISPVPVDTACCEDIAFCEELDSLHRETMSYIEEPARTIIVGSHAPSPPPSYDHSASSEHDNPRVELTSSTGKLLYSIPDTMVVGKHYTIVLRIANRHVSSSISAGIESRKKSIIDIKVSSEMEVTIIDPNSSFAISKNNNDIQIIDSIEYTEWIYNVSPLKSGKQVLNVIVSTVNKNGKKDRVYFNDVYVVSNPTVAVKKFWDSEWKWLFSTFVIPLIIYFYKKRKKDKSDENV